MSRPKQRMPNGFSLLQVIIAIALTTLFVTISIKMYDAKSKRAEVLRTVATRNRVWTGITTVAGIPAAIRNSARVAMSDGVTPVNKALNECITGNGASTCTTGVETPFTLFSPIMSLDAAGNPIDVTEYSTPKNAVPVSHFDVFGRKCDTINRTCIFDLYTSFVPTCGPAKLAVMPANPLAPNKLVPAAKCLIAETISVHFSLEISPAAIALEPDLYSSIKTYQGVVETSVKKIIGSDPQ